MREVAKRVTSVTAVTGFTESLNLPANVTVLSTGATVNDQFMAASVAARFAIQCGYLAARELTRHPPSLFHHMLPFGLDQTFNPAQPFFGRLPLVIGPVQGQAYHEFEHITQGGADMEQRKPSTPLSNRLMRYGKPLLRALNHALVDRAQAIVASSREAANFLSDRVSPDRLHVIPPGVDTHVFTPDPARQDDGVIKILTVGYFLHRKRVDIVLRALRKLLDRGVRAKLIVAGDGPERELLRTLSGELQLEEHVEWLGFIRNYELPAIYRRADVFVSASMHEGLPTVFLEALSSGLPLVCTGHQGSRAVIDEESIGRIVPQEDPEAMAAGIAEIAADRNALDARSVRVRAIATGRYDWGVIGNRYAEVYEVAAARASEPKPRMLRHG